MANSLEPVRLVTAFLRTYWRYILVAASVLSAGLIHFFGFSLALQLEYRQFLDTDFRYRFSSEFVLLFLVLSFVSRYLIHAIFGLCVFIYQQRIDYIYGKRGYTRYPTAWSVDGSNKSESWKQIRELWERKKIFDESQARVANLVKRKVLSQPIPHAIVQGDLTLPPLVAIATTSLLYVGALRTVILLLILLHLYVMLLAYENIRDRIFFDLTFIRAWSRERREGGERPPLDIDDVARMAVVLLIGSFLMGAFRLEALKDGAVLDIQTEVGNIQATIIASVEAGLVYYTPQSGKFGLAMPTKISNP